MYLVVTETVTREHKTSLLPILDDMALFREISLLVDASSFKYLTADSACKAKGSGKSAGKMSAASYVVEALVSERTCVVSVTGTGKL